MLRYFLSENRRSGVRHRISYGDTVSTRVSLPFVFLLEVFVFEASLPEVLDVQ